MRVTYKNPGLQHSIDSILLFQNKDSTSFWSDTLFYGRDAYDFRENSIVVTIPFKWINVMGNKLGNKPGNKSSELNDTQYRILSEIRNNPNVTKQQLAIILNKSKTTIDNGIAALREKRYIIRVGSNKTGYWKVQDPDE